MYWLVQTSRVSFSSIDVITQEHDRPIMQWQGMGTLRVNSMVLWFGGHSHHALPPALQSPLSSTALSLHYTSAQNVTRDPALSIECKCLLLYHASIHLDASAKSICSPKCIINDHYWLGRNENKRERQCSEPNQQLQTTLKHKPSVKIRWTLRELRWCSMSLMVSC